jgi:rSAM/selenodomain-associated transferase 1
MAARRLVLGIFARWPLPGSAKTRLAAAIGADGAARVARAFLRDTLDRFAAMPVRRVVAFTPDDVAGEIATLTAGRYVLRPQGDGDLGARMHRFLATEVDAGADAVVLLGTDSPTLPVAFVIRAFAELEAADLVLGPAADGGYYLLGCGRRVPPIFDGVTWGCSRVLAETAARVPQGWSLRLLPPWYDVDTPDAWEMLRGHVTAVRRAGADPGIPATEEVLREAWLGTSPERQRRDQ